MAKHLERPTTQCTDRKCQCGTQTLARRGESVAKKLVHELGSLAGEEIGANTVKELVEIANGLFGRLVAFRHVFGEQLHDDGIEFGCYLGAFHT